MCRNLAVLAVLTLAACGSDNGLHKTTLLLNDRLQTQLAPDIAAGTATVQPLPDGARVTLANASLFTNTVRTRTDQYADIRASVIEGFLDPSLVRVAVADTSALPAGQREIRVRNVIGYFQDNGIGRTVVPDAGSPGPSAVPGLVITITLDCPARGQPGNWSYGPAAPSCH